MKSKKAYIKKTIELLRVARCPNINCVNRIVRNLDPYTHELNDIEQCQWCSERFELIKEYDGNE